jgi:Secretion system C-terminal sorting domain
MKKNLITLCICISTLFASAQYTPLVSENNYWKCLSYGWGTQYFDYLLNGDTTINLVQYKKLYRADGNEVYYSGLLREDIIEQRVFINTSNEDVLLYDFSLEVNDTATVYGAWSMHDIVVTEVNTVLVNETYRKKIVFDELNGWSPGYWIEGVGSVYGLPDAALGQITDYSPVLSCFYEGNNLAWDNPDNEDLQCSSTLSTNEIEQVELNFFPNPASEKLNWTLPTTNGNSIMQIEIYNSTGQMCKSIITNSNQIEISDLASGIYSIRFSNDEKLIGMEKLVVE